ncbi:MAG TPA: DUF559 domain-containing protein, partial [Rhizomicrobium sp.]|nr:DUF559 domain-containing protein [Rhizomicrobium sp.]
TSAKDLRRKMTEAEVMLWSKLRRNSVYGLKFRRQHPVGPYIADFACVPSRLIVEVDGATHCSDEELAYDRKRDAFLKEQGWRVVRIWNGDIYKDLDTIVEMIGSLVRPLRPASPDTSPVNGGGK